MDSGHFMELNVQSNAPIQIVVSHCPPFGLLFHRENESGIHHFSKDMIEVHKTFWCKIDNLFVVQICKVCNESYPGIQVVRWHEGPIYKRCNSERGAHHFSCFNNMDPGEQYEVLRVLTQIEEMLIA